MALLMLLRPAMSMSVTSEPEARAFPVAAVTGGAALLLVFAGPLLLFLLAVRLPDGLEVLLYLAAVFPFILGMVAFVVGLLRRGKEHLATLGVVLGALTCVFAVAALAVEMFFGVMLKALLN